MEKERLHEQFEAYLDGTLPDAERTALENLMNQQPALREELEIHRRLQKLLSDPEQAALQRQLYQIRKENEASDTRKQVLKKLGIALGLGFLLLLVVWLLRRPDAEPAPAIVSPPADTMAVPTTVVPADTVKPRRSEAPAAPIAQQPKPSPRNVLEPLIGQLLDSSYVFENTTLQCYNAADAAHFSFVLEGKLSAEGDKPALLLQLVDKGYPRTKALLSAPVQLQELDGTQKIYAFVRKKTFLMSATLEGKVPPGKYYAVIVPVENPGKILWAGWCKAPSDER